MDDEDFVDLFVEEVGEHLEALDKNLLALEEDNWQPDTVNSLMRAAHTIKGAAMLMNFDPMAKLAHAMEDRLRSEEKRNRPVPPALIDLLLAGTRTVREMVEEAGQVRDLVKIQPDPAWDHLTTELLEAPIDEPPVDPVEAAMEAELDAAFAAAAGAGEPGVASPSGGLAAGAHAPAEGAAGPVEGPAKTAEGPAKTAAKPAAKRKPPKKPKKAGGAAEESAIESPGAAAGPAGTGAPGAVAGPAGAGAAGAAAGPAGAGAAGDPPAAAPPAPPRPAARKPGRAAEPPKELIKIPVEKVDQLNDLVGELLIYQAKLEQKEENLREMTRRLENLVANSERARLVGLAPLPPAVQDLQEDLSEYVEELSGDLVELNYLSADIRRRSLQIRMLPAQTMLQEFRLAVRDLRRRLRKEAELVIFGGEIELDKRLLEELRPAILHIVRNCMDHGVETPEVREVAGKPRAGRITLTIRVEGARVHIAIEDDGAGMDAARIRERAVQVGIITPETAGTMSTAESLYLIMQPGFSTSESVTDVSGRGVGMDVVRTQVEDLKGTIKIETTPGEGSRFLLDLPLTLSTAQVLMVEVAGQTLAIPIGYVEETLLLDPEDVFREGGHPVFRLRDRTVSVYEMGDFLAGLRARSSQRHHFDSVVILQGRGQRVGFRVQRFLEQSEVVVKTLGTFVQSVSYISGATILGDGKPALILDVPDLLSSLALSLHRPAGNRTSRPLPRGEGQRLDSGGNRKILVVDDSITTRALQKGILENQGYEVHTAAGAEEALRLLDEDGYDLVMTDIEMPEMDGFQLTERIRAIPDYSGLPIVICSVKGSEEDRLRGMRLGAQAYLVKREFDQDEFCAVVRRLVQ